MKKIKVAILFGGRSAEHEISILSAKNVIIAINKIKYEVVEMFVPKTGEINVQKLKNADVVFPILHGPYGEDGTVQGLLKLANIPFVGAGVLGSAVGMDKDVQKRLLRDAKIPTAKFIICHAELISASKILKQVQDDIGKLPVFVKPANLGSSVGISKVQSYKDLIVAVKNAFKYDQKIIVEEAIVGKEVEISVLGNEDPIASVVGEIQTNKKHDFYSYEAKYLDENGATLVIPARITKIQENKIQRIAIKAYQALCCEGMARVDMFLTKIGTVYVNEINTIPGFTNISMYPKLWGASGLSQTKLIDKLIQLALDRFQKEQKLKTSR